MAQVLNPENQAMMNGLHAEPEGICQLLSHTLHAFFTCLDPHLLKFLTSHLDK